MKMLNNIKINALVILTLFGLLISSYSVPLLSRGPFLQMGTTNSITIRWRTSDNADSVVAYGTNVNSLDTVVTNTAQLFIQGERKANALTFSGTKSNISARARTTNVVSWAPELWVTEGATGTDQRTPNLSSLIQEIIDLASWNATNGLAFIISGSGERVAESAKGGTDEPVLHVEYSSAGGGGTNDITVATDTDDAEEFIKNTDVSTNSSDLELGKDAKDGSIDTDSQLVGIRFVNTGIPSGATLNNAYIQFTVDETNNVAAEHEVVLTNLMANTKYFYQLRTGVSNLTPSANANYFFETPPHVGAETNVRIWVLGDCGEGGVNPPSSGNKARQVRDAFEAWNGGDHADVWLMLGDNAYDDGTDQEYQDAIFENMYEATLRNSVLWTTLGNHEFHQPTNNFTDSSLQSGTYYDTFTMPRFGQAGGLASGTEAYFSFDYANIHFISLESENVESDEDFFDAMSDWLTDDIQATTQKWRIAFWHHPPYSKGTHYSDGSSVNSEEESGVMRTNIVSLLEDNGVDVVLAGHSHVYERSFLLDGHHGNSRTLDGSHVIDAGNGRIGSDGAYKKLNTTKGVVYVTTGSSSTDSGRKAEFTLPPPHPVMKHASFRDLGSLVIDVFGDRLDGYFINNATNVLDQFTICKGICEDTPFEAYNDLSWGSGQPTSNITRITTDVGNGTPPEGDTGLLVDEPTGLSTPILLQVEGGNWNGSGHTTQGKISNSGTSGRDEFGADTNKISAVGVIAQNISTNILLTLSGLSTNMRYEVVVFGNRDNSSYTDRVSQTNIQGANNFTNESTAGTSGPTNVSTVITNGYNTTGGFVAKYTNIDPGPDGEIIIEQADGGSASPPAFYINVIKVKAFTSRTNRTIECRATAEWDTAEEDSSGNVDLTSSDLELVDDNGVQEVGIRFPIVNIPKAAAVTNAYIQFTADEADTGNLTLTIHGENVDDAPVFTNQTSNVSSRTDTTAMVSWSPSNWGTVGQAGAAQRTDNLSSIVQEVVDRMGWKSGNALAFKITGSNGVHRVARSGNETDALAELAPLLHVEYTIGASSSSSSEVLLMPDADLESMVELIEIIGSRSTNDKEKDADDTHTQYQQAYQVLKDISQKISTSGQNFQSSRLGGVSILTSGDFSSDTSGWNAIDNDEDTAWVGNPNDQGWWLLAVLEKEIKASDIKLVLSKYSLQQMVILTSDNAREWTEFNTLVSSDYPTLKYLWIIFPDDTTDLVPQLREILLEGE